MDSTKIAGISVPVWNHPSALIHTQTLIECDSVVSNLQKILPPLLENYPVLLVGDAGVGKNALIYYINDRRKKATYRFSFNEDTLPEDIIGSYRLKLEGGGFEWMDGILPEALRKGYSFVADEMNLASPAILKRFMSLFEGRHLDLLEGGGERVEIHSGFEWIGTQNPQEGFEGRKPLPHDITKHFVQIVVDPYSPDELKFIIQKLYPQIKSDIIEKIIILNALSEKKVSLGEIGKGDLEKYHFNLRTLKKYFKRIDELGTTDPDILYQEAHHLYVDFFRKEEDRNSQTQLLEETLKIKSQTSIPVQLLIREGSLFCNNKSLEIYNESLVRSMLEFFPLVPKFREFLEKLITGLQFQENIMIEYADHQDPEVFFPLISRLLGSPVSEIRFSKGMHTSDIIGSLKPKQDGGVQWVDGPLVRGIREGHVLFLVGLETCGSELIEKLNMLTDDARSISIPPESGFLEPIPLKPSSRVIACKPYRLTKQTPTFSRAFRNRFTSIRFPNLEDPVSLKEIMNFYLENENLTDAMVGFHLRLKDLSSKRMIGGSNILAYTFSLTNLMRWKDYVYRSLSGVPEEVIFKGGMISYIYQISDPKEREELTKVLQNYLKGISDLPELFQKLEEKKKTFTKESHLDKQSWWDPTLHERDPVTGKAKKLNSGDPLKRGIEINTPETGGDIKEGPDAWYGKETKGNMGQGEPAGGGGAWGYRTEELYKQFLQKRRLLWDYSMNISLSEFKEIFGKSLEETELNLEKLFDPEIDIIRKYSIEGRKVDARKYLAFLNGKGDRKVFDKTIIDKNEEKLKGVEVVFLISKCRRIFNFEYSIASLGAILVSSFILSGHEIPFSISSYSDLKNSKDTIDIVNSKSMHEDYDSFREEQLFQALCKNWHGDSIPEYQILNRLDEFFSIDATTKIVVILSDFRGQRAKATFGEELASIETRRLKEAVQREEKKGFIFLGIGMGPRPVAGDVFNNSIQIDGDNFFNMPNLVGRELSELILKNHSLRNGS
jgi:MoxR-like ATPase